MNEERLKNMIEKLITAAKWLLICMVAVFVAFGVCAVVIMAGVVAEGGKEAFMLAFVICGFAAIALVIALAGVIIAAHVTYRKLKKSKGAKNDAETAAEDK